MLTYRKDLGFLQSVPSGVPWSYNSLSEHFIFSLFHLGLSAALACFGILMPIVLFVAFGLEQTSAKYEPAPHGLFCSDSDSLFVHSDVPLSDDLWFLGRGFS